jgi:hypothetical protein
MNYRENPVVIGATGGSGSRVIADICRRIGYFMGNDVNISLDSMVFPRFLDRWVDPCLQSWGKPLERADLTQMDSELRGCIDQHRAAIVNADAPWGWKNPRSLLILPYLHHLLPGMRFIHVVRDGRDMAYSSNHHQAEKHFKSLLGTPPAGLSLGELTTLFWSETNANAADFAQRELGQRYLCIRLEDLCAEPLTVVGRIVQFLDTGRAQDLNFISQSVNPPDSIGRWKLKPAAEVQKLTHLGERGIKRFNYG